jgi:hypothetical protein
MLLIRVWPSTPCKHGLIDSLYLDALFVEQFVLQRVVSWSSNHVPSQQDVLEYHRGFSIISHVL